MDAVEKLGEEIAELAAHLDSATQRLLACIRSFDEAGGWERQGAISCAHWLAWRLSLDTATAREKVRVARALGSLPAIDQALGRGELSYAKARALTRVATPANEQQLLELARHATGAQLERICRGYRRATQALDDQAPPAEERSVRERVLPGGMVKLELVLSADEAALVMKAIEKARDDLRHEHRRHSETAGADVSPEAPGASEGAAPEGPVASRVDGLIHLAEGFLAGGLLAPGCGPADGGAGSARGSGADRYQVLVHLDQAVLEPDGHWAATLDDGTHISPETLRRMACDAGLVATKTAAGAATGAGESSVLDIGRRSRSIPPAIRRALWLRDRGCRFPGCPHTRFLHGHHIQHWLHGGATRLDNLVLLCSRHHHLVHEGGFTLQQDTGDGPVKLTFRAPNGETIAAVPTPAQVEDAVLALQTWAEQRQIPIDPSTNFPWWDRAVPDYDLAVSSLMDQ